MKILINGNFLNRNLTGIERFSFETCNRLDSLLTSEDNVSILVAKNAKNIPAYKNIKIVHSEKEIHGFPMWDLIEFKKACRYFEAEGLNFSNTAPLGKNCGFAFIHDIYAKDFPADFTSKKDKLIKAYCRLNYRNIAKHAKKVFTVSEFSKRQIIKAYGTKEENIVVIPNGWEHFKSVKEDENIFQKFPELKNKDFYFTLGSLSKRKNLKWIATYASVHPEETFAVSGKAISGLVPPELESLKELRNVVLVGYVSDEEVKSLMKNCKAFVFPSYYEGFGIPPLEALSTGARIIVSNAASLPEIYRTSAVYIDPENTGVNLSELLSQKTEDGSSILQEYTYDRAAKILYETLKSNDSQS